MKRITLLLTLIATSLAYGQTEQEIKKTYSAIHGSIECVSNNLTLVVDEDISTATAIVNKTVTNIETNKFFTFRMNFAGTVADGDVSTSRDQMITEKTDTGNNFEVRAAGKNGITYDGCTPTQGNKVMYAVVEFTGDYVVSETYSATFNIYSGVDGNEPANTLTNNTITLNITVEEALSNSSLKGFNFSYGPNPSKETINLSANNNIESVQLISLLGQTVISKKLNSTNETLDISNLTNGIYLMNVTIGGSKGTFKVVKE